MANGRLPPIENQKAKHRDFKSGKWQSKTIDFDNKDKELVFIRPGKYGEYDLTFSYDAKIVDAIKQLISSERFYNAEKKIWHIKDTSIQTLRDIFSEKEIPFDNLTRGQDRRP